MVSGAVEPKDLELLDDLARCMWCRHCNGAAVCVIIVVASDGRIKLQADRHLQDGQFMSAISLYSQIIEEQPKFVAYPSQSYQAGICL